jgi:hypothetical protein
VSVIPVRIVLFVSIAGPLALVGIALVIVLLLGIILSILFSVMLFFIIMLLLLDC